ncbi:Inner membrane metabolite transport protein YgcS [Caulifigura coniformis]|uniref:Inner membrane metabolite transport protein YgcS n=1 Tax=Caulifigura coniformis TaxID=2527983 RepID=A0A517SMX3_9PLAN|nr:MFS transporter [Caulifigura coniformis]QDT57473.1 Inner membrane metabolite transport protein YgcS [Caulifigura coniformis]
MSGPTLSPGGRIAVLAAASLGLVFDGVELGLMPVASLSISRSLLGESYTPTLGGDWFARFTAALMLGAALGGIWLGSLGDRIGRTRAMGLSILCYSVFAALGAFARTQEEMLILRFLVGLGVGGVWPNAIALVSECWPNASRPMVSGVMSAALNAGILLLSQLARVWPITPDTWRWVFQLAGLPAVLGILVLIALPESPRWLVSRGEVKRQATPIRELFGPSLWRLTLAGIVISSIPMVGAWAASKWMIPWSDKIAGASNSGYKAATQGWWALGATLGSFSGAQLASLLGRRLSYALISVGSCLLTVMMFQWTAPLEPAFHAVVFAQGFVATLFFGWLALFLPELFPTHVRATGTGLSFNSGRFATAVGVLAVGFLFRALGGDYPRVGTICAMIYGLGLFAIWWAPVASRSTLND